MKDRVKIHELTIKELNDRKKIIRVFLPNDYEKSSERYPVLYMADGQNLVDPSPYSGYSWDVLNTADSLRKKGKVSGIIIVGIDSDLERRMFEYSGAFSDKGRRFLAKKMPLQKVEAEGEIYARFLVRVVKPFIDINYRTLQDREHTGVAGSSCGGVISLYIGAWYPEIFRVIGAFSPAYWITKADLYSVIKEADFPDEMNIYQDMGTKEGYFGNLTFLKDLRSFDKLLKSKVADPIQVEMVIDPHATHTELFWQARFLHFLERAFPKK